MDDQYRIDIPSTFNNEIKSWNLPTEIRASMENALREMASNPTAKLVTLHIYPDVLYLSFPDNADPKRTYQFAFRFRYGTEHNLKMVECDFDHTGHDDSKTPKM